LVVAFLSVALVAIVTEIENCVYLALAGSSHAHSVLVHVLLSSLLGHSYGQEPFRFRVLVRDIIKSFKYGFGCEQSLVA